MLKTAWRSLFIVGLSGAWVHASSVSAEILRMADAYGLSGWDSVESLHYTFHVKNGAKATERKWEWDVKTDQVVLETEENGQAIRVSYSRKSLDEGDAALNRKADQWFINDQYWLLFPLHLEWDTDATITLEGEKQLPMSRGLAAKLTIAYPAQGGYTPGDMYEIFYGPVSENGERIAKPPEGHRWADSPYIFRQWVFHKGGSPKPTMVTNWSGYERLGPLVVATEHHDAGGHFHLYFSDLSIKLVDDAAWKQPESVDPPSR